MKIINLTCIALLMIACNGQEQKTKAVENKNKSDTIITKINKEMREKFDFEVFNKSEENEGIYILPNKNTVYMMGAPNPEYLKKKEEALKRGAPSYYWEGDGNGFQYERLPKPLFETIYKEFNAEGYIIKKEHYIGENTKIGISEYYDEKGNVKKVDEDKKFGKIKPIDALRFLETKGILNLKTGEAQQTTYEEDKFAISFVEENGRKYFVIVIKEGKPYDGPIGKGEPPAGSSVSYYMDGETGTVTTEEEEKNKTVIYKTHQGKSYTQTEWEIFEQEQYNEHLRKTGRADLIKPTDKSKMDNSKSFLADENDIKPQKKKSFWDNLFG